MAVSRMRNKNMQFGSYLWPNRQNCCTVQPWTCELGDAADTMFYKTYFLFPMISRALKYFIDFTLFIILS